MPFDLLVWNSDSTRMPAANHKFYLRHCYFQNDLSNGRMVLGGKTIDLNKVTIPIYELASREDHIAPARGVFTGAQVLWRSGAVRHGRLRPYRRRRQPGRQAEIPVLERRAAGRRFRVLGGGAPRRRPAPGGPTGSHWVTAQAPEKVPARKPGEGKLKAIGDAPGDYVRIKA